jgi:hypothetical protein
MTRLKSSISGSGSLGFESQAPLGCSGPGHPICLLGSFFAEGACEQRPPPWLVAIKGHCHPEEVKVTWKGQCDPAEESGLGGLTSFPSLSSLSSLFLRHQSTDVLILRFCHQKWKRC